MKMPKQTDSRPNVTTNPVDNPSQINLFPINGNQLGWWLAIYLLLHGLIRLIFSDTMQWDDAEQVVLGQELALGYDIPQPPLYTWLYWLTSRWFGIGLPVLTGIKYLLTAAMFAVLWRISRYLFKETEWRIAALSSFLLLPVLGWQLHIAFTHTVLMMLACAMTFHAILAIGEQANWCNCAYLAGAVSVGLLSKYGYHSFLLILLASALTLADWRTALLRPLPLSALVLAVIVATPYHVWLYEHREWVFHTVSHKFLAQHGIKLGAFAALRPVLAIVEYLFPLLLVLLWVAPRSLLKNDLITPERNSAVLARFHLVLAVLFIVGIIGMQLVGLGYFKYRWMAPFLFLTPLWLLKRIHTQKPAIKSATRITTVATVVSLLILAVRIGDFLIGPKIGSQSRLHWPINLALIQLPAPCRETPVVIAENNFIAAHARMLWPDKLTYSAAIHPIHRVALRGQTVAVLSQQKSLPPNIGPYLNTTFNLSLEQAHSAALGKTTAYNHRTEFSLYCHLLSWH